MKTYDAILFDVVELLRQYGAWIETHNEHGNFNTENEFVDSRILSSLDGQLYYNRSVI